MTDHEYRDRQRNSEAYPLRFQSTGAVLCVIRFRSKPLVRIHEITTYDDIQQYCHLVIHLTSVLGSIQALEVLT